MKNHCIKTTTPESQIDNLLKRITIHNKQVENAQRSLSLMTVLIPSLGTAIAIGSLDIIGCNTPILIMMVIFYSLTMLGITVGYHRYFSHSSFRALSFVQAGLLILGSMAVQGPVIYWVSNHRRHHQFCEQTGDPHSPHTHGNQLLGQLQGFWHAHVGWMFNREVTNASLFAKDLIRDPFIAKINQRYWWWVLLGLLMPTILGGLLLGSWIGAIQGFLWGGLVRIFLVHHAIWSINSITHLWGNRPFSTGEQSANNCWLAIPTLGENWHHNHHAFPQSAYVGLEWWQIDMSGWVIRGLKRLGWVWDVKRPTDAMIAAKKSSKPE